MQLKKYLCKALCSFVVCVSAVSGSFAQSADIFEGIKAPAAVKVDGKLTEWGELPAYSKSTTLRYTVANDAKNLYLAITCTDDQNINKLLAGGLTITINKEGKKKDKDAVVIQYPMASRGGGMRGMRMGGGRGATVDTAALVAARKQSVTAAKELSVIGVKEITDTLVSIYNTYGLKTGITFNPKGNLFYEIAIPLQLLELSADKPTELAYNLKLNGIQFGQMRVQGDGGGRQGGGNGGGNGGGFGIGSITISGGGGMMDMAVPTDFWGKYKLAKP